jgi:uncharacterized membrane protein
MNLSLYYQIYWPLLILLSLTKPISDYFWLEKFKKGYIKSIIKLFKQLIKERYLYMILVGLLCWLTTFLVFHFRLFENFFLIESLVLALTIIFMVQTIVSIKSILVVGLISVTFGNFFLLQLFMPITEVADLDTLNNLLSNLISIFNFIAVGTAAAGLVWQFGRHNDEETYATVSTIFYAIGYILLNMFLSFILLVYPIIKKINELAVLAS